MEPQTTTSPPPGFSGRQPVNPPPGFSNSSSASEKNKKPESSPQLATKQSDSSSQSAQGADRRGRGRGGALGGGRGGKKPQQTNQPNKTETEQPRGGKSGRGGARGGSGGNNQKRQPKQKLQNIGDSYAPAQAEHEIASVAESIDIDDDSLSVSTSSSEAFPDDWPVCLTCCEPIRWFCVGACNHTEVCAMCTIRMRKLYDDKDCCICKKPLDRVIVTKEKDKKFEELDEAIKEVPLLLTQKIDGANLYITDADYFKHVSSLFDVTCPKCNEKFTSVQSLCQHVSKVHNLLYCELCLKHRKVFLSEQILYTSASQLAKHAEKGDPSLKLKPHPWCKYCDVCFFSDEELFRHCEESHFKCWICERSNILFNYFRDYKHLEEHFDNKHFLCREKDCLEKKFVVFRTQFELQAHEVSNHLGKKGLSRSETLAARTVQLNFNVRGSSGASTSADLDESSAYQQQQQAMYQSRISGNNGRNTRPAETPVFFPDDRRRHDNHGGRNESRQAAPAADYNAQDTGFNLSDRLPASVSKPAAPSAASSSSAAGQPAVPQLTAQERSKNLIAKIKAFLGSDFKFTEFRRISAMFKQSQMAPQHYYAQFLKNFGESAEAYALFEEMVDLLPDVKKQEALLEMHRKHQRLASEFPALALGSSSSAAAIPAPRTWSQPSSRVAAPLTNSAPVISAPRGPPQVNSRDDFPSLGGASEAFPALPAAAPAQPAAPSWPAAPGNRNQGVTYNAAGKKGKKVLLRYG